MRCIAKFSFLALVVAIVVVPCRGNAEEFVELSVMTYNIQAAIHMYPELSTEENLEALAQVIERDDPDILFAQEVMRFDPLVNNIDEFEWLRQRLGYANARYASGQEDPVPPGTAEWGVATYFREGSMVSSEKYRLESQGRTMLRVTASIHDMPVHLFNTHLGGNQPEQVAKVKNWMEDFTPLNAPIILGGDFNETPDSDALAPLRSILENVFEGSVEQPIDSFFVSPGVDFFDAQVVPDPTEASDHDPSVFTWRVPEPTADHINYVELWDSYAVGDDDPDFVANWPTDPADAARYEVVMEDDRANSNPMSLMIRKDRTCGITHDLTTDAMLAGQWVEPGTGDDALVVSFIADFKDAEIQYADIFVEISSGGAHAPSSGENPDVIAFGMTYGINGLSTHPWVYDGVSWQEATEITTNSRWNLFELTITPTELTIVGSRGASGSHTFTNDSNNRFDHISVRTIDNDDNGQRRWIDDILLAGGEISGLVLGDMNGDGQVNNLDVDPFIDVLLNGPFNLIADMNQDDQVNGLDVGLFVSAVASSGNVTAVPEPSTFALVIVGLLALVVRAPGEIGRHRRV